MKFSEQILKSWTAPLSTTEQQRVDHTINMIKSAFNLDDNLRKLNFEVFAQGSYANNTNVRSDSDIDVCVMLKSTFYFELPQDKTRDDYGIGPGTISYEDFYTLVKKAIINKFGAQNTIEGNKSLKIKQNTYHVQADVVPAFQLRNYAYNNSQNSWNFVEGIRFFAKDGQTVTNYPKIHIENGKNKNIRTNHDYKKLVRIMKHLRNSMVDDKITDGNKISSFLIECLVWNIPDRIITGYSSWDETVRQAIAFLYGEIDNNRHKNWGEVSEMLYLFYYGRKWADQDAKQWLCDAWSYQDYR